MVFVQSHNFVSIDMGSVVIVVKCDSKEMVETTAFRGHPCNQKCNIAVIERITLVYSWIHNLRRIISQITQLNQPKRIYLIRAMQD